MHLCFLFCPPGDEAFRTSVFGKMARMLMEYDPGLVNEAYSAGPFEGEVVTGALVAGRGALGNSTSS